MMCVKLFVVVMHKLSIVNIVNVKPSIMNICGMNKIVSCGAIREGIVYRVFKCCWKYIC